MYTAIDRKDWAAGTVAMTNDSTTNAPGSPRCSPDSLPSKAGGNVSSDEPPKFQRVIPQSTVPTIAGYSSHFSFRQGPSDATLAYVVANNNPDEEVAKWVAKTGIPTPPPSDEDLKVPALQVRKKSSQPSALHVSSPAPSSKDPQSSRHMPTTKPSIPNWIDGTVPGPPEQEPISVPVWKGKQAVYQHALDLSPEEQQEELNSAFRLAMKQQFPSRELPTPKPVTVCSTTTTQDQLMKHPAQALSPDEQRDELHEALRLATGIWKKQLPEGDVPVLEPDIVCSSTELSHKQPQGPSDQRLRKAVRLAMQEQPFEAEAMCLCGTFEYMHSTSEHGHLPSSNSTLRTSPAPQQVDCTKPTFNEGSEGRQQYAYETLPYQRRGNPKLKIPNKRSPTTMQHPTNNIHPAHRVPSLATGLKPSLEMLDARRGRDANGPYVGAHYMNSARTGRRHFRRST
jgi:hypothetical protein